MSIAQYKNIPHDYICYQEYPNQYYENNIDYVRLTEPLEVEFIMLPTGDIVQKQVDAIDNEIDRLKTEMLKKIDALKGNKAELLSLTFL